MANYIPTNLIIMFYLLFHPVTNDDDVGIDLMKMKVDIKEYHNSLYYNFININCKDCRKSFLGLRCSKGELVQRILRTYELGRHYEVPFNFTCKLNSGIKVMPKFSASTISKIVRLSWTRVDEMDKYIVIYMNKDETKKEYFGSTTESVDIAGLTDNMKYRFCIGGIDYRWATTYYRCLTVLIEFITIGPVINVKMNSFENGSVDVSWSKPNDNPEGYLVEYVKVGQSNCHYIIIDLNTFKMPEKLSCKLKVRYQWTSLKILKIEKLELYSQYKVIITPIIGARASIPVTKYIMTSNNKENKIVINNIVTGYSTERRISWQYKGRDRSQALFTIQYKSKADKLYQEIQTYNSFVTITNLTVNMKYEIHVSHSSSNTKEHGLTSKRSSVSIFYTGNENIATITNDYRRGNLSWQLHSEDAISIFEYVIVVRASYDKCNKRVMLSCNNCLTSYNDMFNYPDPGKVTSLKCKETSSKRTFQRGKLKFEENLNLNTNLKKYYIDVYGVNLNGLQHLFRRNHGYIISPNLHWLLLLCLIGLLSFVVCLIVAIIVFLKNKNSHVVEVPVSDTENGIYDNWEETGF